MRTTPRNSILKILTACLLLSCAHLAAQTTLYYNRAAHPGWYEANGWSISDDPLDFNSNWIQGSAADFGGGAITDFDLSAGKISGVPVEVSGLSNSGSAIRFDGTGTTAVVIDMINNPVVTGTFAFRGRTRILGSYQIIDGAVSHSGSGGGADASERTITVTNGSLVFNSTNRTNSTLTVDLTAGSELTYHTFSANASTVGRISATDSTIRIGSLIGGSGATSGSVVHLLRLEGNAGSTLRATPYSDSRVANTGSLSTLTINQSANTEFAGTVNGFGPNSNQTVGGGNWLQLIKTGTGDLTLSGTIENMIVPTLVEGGRLFINSASSSFGDSDGTTALHVQTGATLGGTGVIGTLDGDHIIFDQGAGLIAGLPNVAGLTTFALGTGSVLNLSAATGEAGWLKFALGSADTAGISYDQLLLSSGAVDIGAGAMAFSDFDFTLLGGFGIGTYTLLSSSNLIGSLADSEFLSGELDGYDAMLSLNGNDIVLTVIPEPRTAAVVLAAVVVVLVATRRRRGV